MDGWMDGWMDKKWVMDGSESHKKLIKFVSTNVKDNWVQHFHKTEKLLKWKKENPLILLHNFLGICTNKKYGTLKELLQDNPRKTCLSIISQLLFSTDMPTTQKFIWKGPDKSIYQTPDVGQMFQLELKLKIELVLFSNGKSVSCICDGISYKKC